MSLWADKYRPKTLSELDYHAGISQRLKALSSTGDFPHLLVYGPPGAGKKTRVVATLHELFGASVEKLKVDIQVFTTPSNRKLEFNVISSPHHLEITPSDMGNNDRIVIQDLLKDVAQVESVDFTAKPATKNNKKFKVVIINEAELLTRDAQAALRRTMEKYSSNIRLILICNTSANIIDPIKSRTLLIRIPSPSTLEISDVIDKVSKSEPDFEQALPPKEDDRLTFFRRIADSNDRNLRASLLMAEAIYMYNSRITSATEMIVPDWKQVIQNLATSIMLERSVARLQSSRSTLYELISHAIPSNIILKGLFHAMWANVADSKFKVRNRDEVRSQLAGAVALFDERLHLGSKEIFHLEGFVTKAMVVLETDSVQ